MKTKSFNTPLSGEVEADETFIGGKEKNKHANCRLKAGRGTVGKTAVMGLLARHGEIRTAIVPSTRRHILQNQIRENIAPGSTVYTDALASYAGLDAKYIHQVIDHAESYARGQVHTKGSRTSGACSSGAFMVCIIR
jgi:transposase-like protein